MMALLASAVLMATNAPPAEIVANCRAMLPEEVRLEGRVVLRNRRGIPQAEHDYVLTRKQNATELKIDGAEIKRDEANGNLLGTDVTWSDITLDYLWWPDAAFDGEHEGESVHGQVCTVIALRNGPRTVKVWIDRKTGALMQAEEIQDGRTVRRLWGTRIKKFGERWMANQLEVETIGSGHRTKITVEKLDNEQ